MRALALTLLLASPAAAQLDLSLVGTLDISGQGFVYTGGAAFGDRGGNLWICEATLVNDVVEIDPATGQIVTVFDASGVPNLTAGPDAMALDPTNGNLVLFSAFRGGVAEGVVDPLGNLVTDYGTSRVISGAAFDDQARLWGYSDATRVLIEINPQTGVTLQQIAIAYSGRVSGMDFDPQTNNLFVIADGAQDLLEIDLPSGALLSTTPLLPFLLDTDFPAGIAFNGSGDTLYLSKGDGVGADNVIVLARGGGQGSSYCTPAVPNSSGQPGVLSAFGSLVAGGNPLTLRAESLPPNEFGYFLCSLTQGIIPQAGGSQGILCLALPIGRFAQQIVNSGPNGVMQIPVDTLALPLTPPVAAQAGETWYFQCWYRDVNPGPTSNFTDGIELMFQ